MYVLKETQEYIDKCCLGENIRYYYGGHDPKHAIGDLEGVILVEDINDAQELYSFYQADLIIKAHGMTGQFELIDID